MTTGKRRRGRPSIPYEAKRISIEFSLAPETVAMLEAEAYNERLPLSRIVDIVVGAQLGGKEKAEVSKPD